MKDIYTFKFWKHLREMNRGKRMVVFETSTYFILSFGKRYGVTPLQYRKSNKE